MKRRAFIRLLGSAAAWPLGARAQQQAMPVIGFLNPASPDTYADLVGGFRQGIREIGYVENQNVTVEYRWAEGNYDRLPALAADLVHRPVAVIAATGGDVSALAAKAATEKIPIVFDTSSDPVKIGLVASLNRPGGNLTGVSILTVDLTRKRLELIYEVVPGATLIGFLVNPNRPSVEAEINGLQAAAATLGRQILVLTASNEHDLIAAFATLAQQNVHALIVGPDNFLISRREQIVELAMRNAISTIAPRQFVTVGGLMSYDASLVDAYRLVGLYVGKILKGENPAELPVQQQTKIELTINLRTAKALGLSMPLPVLGRADEVIE